MTKRDAKVLRVGQIVPSSNTTMETEVPAMLRARERIREERFTFHSSRMRMKQVTAEELAAMDRESDRCALELSDARMDVIGYACLVAVMSVSHGYHRVAQDRLHRRTLENDAPAPVVTSAGALIEGLVALEARTISFICPYTKPLARRVVEYIEAEGITVRDYMALEIPDNLTVAAQSPDNLIELYRKVDCRCIDALVLSACVQMPSLSAIDPVERALGMPVVSAASCTVFRMLSELGLEPCSPGGGRLLSGALPHRPKSNSSRESLIGS
jgi:maleate isomerase